MAPPISGTNLLTGKPVVLSGLRGKYVVVDFFASWCAPCENEADALEAFEFSHHRSGDANDPRCRVRRLGVERGEVPPFEWLNVAAVIDRGGSRSLRGVVAIGDFVVAPNGRVIPDYENGQVTESTLNALLAASGGSTT